MKTDEFEKQTGARAPSEAHKHSHLPDGYRSGIITAITVLLGFSLLFLRSWVFELPGDWTPLSLAAAVILLLAIVLDLVALWRSLRPKDEDPSEYHVTLRWFIVAAASLLLSLVVAGFAYAPVK